VQIGTDVVVRRLVLRECEAMMGQSASSSLAHSARRAVMSAHDTAPPGNDAPDDEYDELVQLIVAAEWHPGDIVRTSKGGRWQFRETPYTSDFSEANGPHASGKASKDAFRSRAS
jgi:hypothetical protein